MDPMGNESMPFWSKNISPQTTVSDPTSLTKLKIHDPTATANKWNLGKAT